jgi:ABC-type lipoprotein export system ATPase subunit
MGRFFLPEERIDPPDLRLANAGALFGGAWLFRSLDLAIPSGQWLTIVGPSGSGKTTVLRLLAGLLDPNEGEALVGGRQWARLRGEDRVSTRRRFGYVQQQPGLFHTTVVENLVIPLRWRGMPKERALDVARQGLAAVGLDRLASKDALSLSGGERQRLVFARAIIPRPEILILDEFTNHQDTEREDLLESVVAEHITRGGSAVVVAHDLGHVDRIRRGCGLDPTVGVLLGGLWQATSWNDLSNLSSGEGAVASFVRRLPMPGSTIPSSI